MKKIAFLLLIIGVCSCNAGNEHDGKVLYDKSGNKYLLEFDYNHHYFVKEIDRVQVEDGDTTYILK